MNADRSRTGVCILRVETQSAGCLYTVICNPDISREDEAVEDRYGGLEEALDAARRFLEQFLRTHH